MAFAATAKVVRGISKHSIGPLKVEYVTYSAVSGDTTGTITASRLSTVYFIIMGGGLAHSADPTYSGNVVTLAFNDPVATVKGQAMLIGV